MSSIIDHVGLSVGDYPVSRRFYDAALAPLGIRFMMEFGDAPERACGYGADQPTFWLGEAGRERRRAHVAFVAPNRAAVDAFHAAALANGGTDNGAPGPRPEYEENYYAAFVFDPDGHNIEAVCHAPE